jgi:hypothetical protein
MKNLNVAIDDDDAELCACLFLCWCSTTVRLVYDGCLQQESDLLSTDVDSSLVSTHTLSRVSAGTSHTANLYPYISHHLCHGSNVSPPDSLPSILRPHDTRDLRDDDTSSSLGNLEPDDGVLLTIQFSELVRVKAVLLNAGVEEDRPRRVRIWVNRPDGIDWEEVEEVQPDAEWEPLVGARTAVEYPVRVTRFGNVSTLTIHFVRLSCLSLYPLVIAWFADCIWFCFATIRHHRRRGEG